MIKRSFDLVNLGFMFFVDDFASSDSLYDSDDLDFDSSDVDFDSSDLDIDTDDLGLDSSSESDLDFDSSESDSESYDSDDESDDEADSESDDEAEEPQPFKRKQFSINLHGHTKETALPLITRILNAASSLGAATVTFITGRGSHSANGVPVLRPLVLDLCRRRGVPARVGRNEGRVICQIARK